MRAERLAAVLIASSFALSGPVSAEPLLWGIQVEQAEYRLSSGGDIAAWDFDAFAGYDEWKVVWRSEAEYEVEESGFEKLENQLRLQVPISDFFDAVAGVRVDTPSGDNRIYGVVGIHGLTRQWFEIDVDFFVSGRPQLRFEAEYEALLTNRIILIPSIELDLPLVDDEGAGYAAFGPKLEVGARLSYDLIDRAVSPYIGVNYERYFGGSADIVRDDGEDAGGVYFVVGSRFVF